MQINAAYNQELIDIAVMGCGDATRLFEVAQLNGLGITDLAAAGTAYDTPAAVLTKQKLVSLFSLPFNAPASNEDMRMEITGNGVLRSVNVADNALRVEDGQTVIDMAMQTTGDAARIFDYAQMNGIAITDDISAGDAVTVPSATIDKAGIVKMLAVKANKPASGYSTINTEEGIGFWIIEKDFKVS